MTFDECFRFIVSVEGGLSEDPQDKGGITKYGISLKSYPHLGETGIRNLTLAQAKKIYKTDFWNKGMCPLIPMDFRLMLFDAYVNLGVTQGIRLAQKVLKIKVDGDFGPQTKKALNEVDTESFINDFFVERALFYTQLNDFSRYGRGWIKRILMVQKKIYQQALS
jgi:lysozyme family protein